MKTFLVVVLSMLAAGAGYAQQAPAVPPAQPPADLNAQLLESAARQAGAETRKAYRIGAEDLIEVTVFEVPELSRTVRVSAAGDISLPLIGVVKAAGLSPRELERSLTEAFRNSYVKDPQVSVFLKEYRSDPVSVVGAVKAPGLYQIQTRKSLIELLAMAQGFSENPKMLPGRTVVITHKRAAGANAGQAAPDTASANQQAADPLTADPPIAASQIEEIPLKELLENGDPKWNVPVYPGDVIKVVPAGTFYVAGDVKQPGGFPLTDFDTVTAMQAVAMAGGPTRTAKLKEAMIIRRDAAGNRVEEKIDLSKVFEGDAADAKVGANEILFIPGSVRKAAGLRAVEASIQVATGLLIFGL